MTRAGQIVRPGGTAGHIVLSLPTIRAGRLGIAGRTVFYPALAFGADGARTLLRTGPEPALWGNCLRQVLIVAEPPDDRHRALIRSAADAGCPTVVLQWCDAASNEIASLAEDPYHALVTVADPWRQPPRNPDRSAIADGAIAPARSDLDRLVLAKFPSLEPTRASRSSDSLPTSGNPLLTVIVATASDLERVHRPLIRALRDSGGPDLLFVTCDCSGVGNLARKLGIPGDIIEEQDAAWLPRLAGSRAALVAGWAAGERGMAGSSLYGAIWAFTALRAGVPVVTHANPLLDAVSGNILFDDWERGLALYLQPGSWIGKVDAALGQARAAQMARASQSAPVWRAAETALGHRQIASQSRKRPVLLALLDLAQDLDVLLPVLLAVRRRDRFSLRICVTDWLREQSPRTFTLLEQNGFVPEVVERMQARRGAAPGLQGVDAFIAASETNQSAHRAGHALARKAAEAGIATFALQHGFENIGLTYRDEVFGRDVCFASETVFVWFPAEKLPDWVSRDTRRRIVAVGSPKMTPSLADQTLPDVGRWSRKIGLFENLHWHRFGEMFKRDLFDHLDWTAQLFPDTIFLIKPHNAGRWAVKNPGLVPVRDNIRIIDPLDPDWQTFTAPTLMPHLDAVITTPSTVAVDAARAGKPVAVIGNGLDLALYAPLPILAVREDWCGFLSSLDDRSAMVERNEIFLRSNFLPHAGQWRMADLMFEAVASKSEQELRPK